MLPLAANAPSFPVTLTLRLSAPTEATALELQQTDWKTGDYRTARFSVDVSVDGTNWTQAATAELPNQPGARQQVPLPIAAIKAVRLRILSTHDRQGAMSCGLKNLRLLSGNKNVALAGTRIFANSQFPGHEAQHLLAADPQACKEAHYTTQVNLEDLRDARRRMDDLGHRRLDLAAVVYAHQLDPAIAPFFAPIDTLLFWTWTPGEITALEKNFIRLKQLLPGKKILLGCYMWNFSVPPGPMPIPLMKHQCELGLRWLKAGEIEGMIFLATNICDLGLETVEWTRQWIAEHGNELLRHPRQTGTFKPVAPLAR
jgi:hypothetical protein